MRDASIEHTFFYCERWRLKRRNHEPKFDAYTIENFCDVMLSIEENWNSMTNYVEALLKSKKFDLDERINVQTASLIKFRNPDVDMNMKGQMT